MKFGAWGQTNLVSGGIRAWVFHIGSTSDASIKAYGVPVVADIWSIIADIYPVISLCEAVEVSTSTPMGAATGTEQPQERTETRLQ